MSAQRYIGLMSGTSTDAVDGVLADFTRGSIHVLASASLPLPAALRRELLALNEPGPDELTRASRAANALADHYATVVQQLLDDANLTAHDIRAIGAHGQTVRHAPDQGYTVQINAPARLAEAAGIAVIADFRSRDVAAGGQGAPLVPAFHANCFGLNPRRAVLNLGGIANLTVLSTPIRGFDTGPANMLMDAWVQRHRGQPFDRDGCWARQGRCHPALLARLLDEPWLRLPPPKSTGRDLFNLGWLQRAMDRLDEPAGLSPADVQATLLELTVQSIGQAVANFAPQVDEFLVCGGGALNPELMAGLARVLPGTVATTQTCGIPVQTMEALAFAWLARAHVLGRPACLPSVTGARHATIAGCLYPA